MKPTTIVGYPAGDAVSSAMACGRIVRLAAGVGGITYCTSVSGN